MRREEKWKVYGKYTVVSLALWQIIRISWVKWKFIKRTGCIYSVSRQRYVLLALNRPLSCRAFLPSCWRSSSIPSAWERFVEHGSIIVNTDFIDTRKVASAKSRNLILEKINIWINKIEVIQSFNLFLFNTNKIYTLNILATERKFIKIIFIIYICKIWKFTFIIVIITALTGFFVSFRKAFTSCQ